MSNQNLPEIDSLWNFGDPAASEEEFRRLIPPASEPGNEAYLAELFTQIARTESLQARFDDANEDLDRAEALGVQSLRVRVRVLLERGRTLNSSGNPDEACPLFLKAFEIAREAGEENLAIDAAHMVAIVEAGEAALEWNLRALELAQAATEPRAIRWQGSLYNNLGWTYHDAGDYEQALTMFRAGYEFQKSQGRDAETLFASWTIARTLRSLGRLDEALALQNDNLAAAVRANAPDGFIQEEIAECLLALGRPDEARSHFARAYNVLSEDLWLSRNEQQRLDRLRTLGDNAR